MADPTKKAVKQLVELMNDRRFDPEWFALMMYQDGSVQEQEIFMDILLSYLGAEAQDYTLGVSKIKNTLMSSGRAYGMLVAYYNGLKGIFPSIS